jgi:glycosyltransferase involved in cell wall biosynthesis
VSVIIPCKDEGVLLSEAVESVLGQKLSVRFEVVIIDDGSENEETLALLSELRDHPAITVITHPTPRGPAGARNAGVAAARGEWIALVDADDLLTPDSLQRRWDVARRTGGECLVAGDFTERSLDGSEASWIDRFETNPELADSIGMIQAERGSGTFARIPAHSASALVLWGVVRTQSAFFTKSAFDAVGGFDERLRVGEDFHLWMRLALDRDICFVPGSVAIYRRREGSLTLGDRHPAERGREATLLLLRDPAFHQLRPGLRGRLLRMDRGLMWHYRRSGERSKALSAALRVLRATPTDSGSWKALAGTLLGR